MKELPNPLYAFSELTLPWTLFRRRARGQRLLRKSKFRFRKA